MKKGTIFLALTIAVIMFPGYGMARIFFLNQSDLALFAEVYENTGGGYSYLISGGHHYPLGDGYQFYGQHANRPVVANLTGGEAKGLAGRNISHPLDILRFA